MKKADKGSRVVVWDRNDYIVEVKKQVNNKSVYKNVIFKEKSYNILLKQVTIFSKVLGVKAK